MGKIYHRKKPRCYQIVLYIALPIISKIRRTVSVFIDLPVDASKDVKYGQLLTNRYDAPPS